MTPNIHQFSGVVPEYAISCELGPPRSECGVGALMPWAGSLWIVSYVSHKRATGVGGGLYELDSQWNFRHRAESVTGTYANRFIHLPSNQLIIGPHVIDAQRRVRTIDELVDVRLTATMRHLQDPDHLVYMLGMEGKFYEVDVHSLEVTRIADLTETLGVPSHAYAHFKAGYTCFGKVVVANNSYDERDFKGTEAAGKLAEWDGNEWRILQNAPFVEVNGRGGFGGTMFASGWDRASAILMVYTAANDTWTRYRLPKASHTFDHMWQTEWPRIRETEHERFLMDCHGMFYELSPWAYDGRIWGVRPISTHLWVLGDFCSYRGCLVMGADNASPANTHNVLTAEPQSGLWFGKTDDLWQFGKPSGWGGPWWETPVNAGEPSDAYLMTGFDRKCLHLAHQAGQTVTFDVEVDVLGNGKWWHYTSLEVGAGEYVHHEFPAGYSAHWLRIRSHADCVATAYLTYT
ncbi:MAG: hypothetical protein D6820_18025 [Lentisphaerae bacterium]|nr:MAG: hypothetical protein D6820_18025 [Lentisphaerota bacterium]